MYKIIVEVAMNDDVYDKNNAMTKYNHVLGPQHWLKWFKHETGNSLNLQKV